MYVMKIYVFAQLWQGQGVASWNSLGSFSLMNEIFDIGFIFQSMVCFEERLKGLNSCKKNVLKGWFYVFFKKTLNKLIFTLKTFTSSEVKGTSHNAKLNNSRQVYIFKPSPAFPL